MCCVRLSSQKKLTVATMHPQRRTAAAMPRKPAVILLKSASISEVEQRLKHHSFAYSKKVSDKELVTNPVDKCKAMHIGKHILNHS